MRRTAFASADDGWDRNKRKQVETDLDITPMIDVTFLLLIFFMVTSTMQATPDLDIPPARHGIGVDKRSTIEIVVTRAQSPGAAPTIAIDGTEVTMDDIRGRVADGVTAGKEMVMILADREVTHGFITEIERAAMDNEGITLQLGVRDKDR